MNNISKTIILVILLLTGCSTLPKAVKPNLTSTQKENKVIHIVSHGWHTGVILPYDIIIKKLPELRLRFPHSKYLEVGWGDSGFYQANEITSGLTFKAIFMPTESVVHVVGFRENPKLYFKDSVVKNVSINEYQLDSLVEFVSNSFKRVPTGELIELKKGIYGDSQFYAGIGNYHAFNTCNKWTAKALYSAGINISPMFKLTASSIMDSLNGKN